jgi:hypothetical protein
MSPRHDMTELTPYELDEVGAQKIAALAYIHEAWEEARHDGLDVELIAHAALFAALSELVKTYGEDAVAQLVKSLPRRVQHGDFTVNRTKQ